MKCEPRAGTNSGAIRRRQEPHTRANSRAGVAASTRTTPQTRRQHGKGLATVANRSRLSETTPGMRAVGGGGCNNQAAQCTEGGGKHDRQGKGYRTRARGAALDGICYCVESTCFRRLLSLSFVVYKTTPKNTKTIVSLNIWHILLTPLRIGNVFVGFSFCLWLAKRNWQ